jgi:hypothetical protein
VQDIVKASIEDLINVPGVGDVTAQKIYLAAVQHLEAVEELRKREAEAAKATTAAPEVPVATETTAPEEAIVAEPTRKRVREPESEEALVPVAAPAHKPEPESKPTAEVKPAAEVKPVLEAKQEAKDEGEVEAKKERATKRKPETPGGYLDDIEAMESELSSGWEAESGGETTETP